MTDTKDLYALYSGLDVCRYHAAEMAKEDDSWILEAMPAHLEMCMEVLMKLISEREEG